MSIDAETMNQVFKHLKIKKNWNEVQELYENWANCYKHDRYQNLSSQELQAITQVFDFKSNIIYTQRNKFIDFLAKNKEFYNDDLDVVIERMKNRRDELAIQYGYELPCINWYPEYGGMLQDPRMMRNRERNWRENHNIPFSQYVSIPELVSNNSEENDTTITLNQSILG